MEFLIKGKKGKARTGVLETAHGKIETPNLAIVATHGCVRMLDKKEHKQADPNFLIANTFHLWVNGEVTGIKKAGGIHKWNGINKPIMTDSGGFQVFSLGWGKLHGIGKVATDSPRSDLGKQEAGFSNPVEINDDGVVFEYHLGVSPLSKLRGETPKCKYSLNPEKSIKIQKDIGADIIFSFDECTSPLHSHAYTKKSLIKTHKWAERSLKEFLKGKKKEKQKQFLFGIVQGGIFEDLRKKSSKFIGSLPFDGFGIGGSFGEREMGEVLGWALVGLPDEKPRHLLGIGKIRDIFLAVEHGVDLFDCVIPTREARHGVIYSRDGRLDIRKSVFQNDKKILDKDCDCFVCKSGITRGEFRQLFKDDKLKAQKLATIHNIQFYKNIFIKIRAVILAGKSFASLKKEYKKLL